MNGHFPPLWHAPDSASIQQDLEDEAERTDLTEDVVLSVELARIFARGWTAGAALQFLKRAGDLNALPHLRQSRVLVDAERYARVMDVSLAPKRHTTGSLVTETAIIAMTKALDSLYELEIPARRHYAYAAADVHVTDAVAHDAEAVRRQRIRRGGAL